MHGMNHSAEQVADSIITIIRKVLGARTVFTSNAAIGTNVLTVENNFHFGDAESVMLIDTDPDHVEYHSILQNVGTNTIVLVNDLQSNFTTAAQATVHKAIGGVPLISEAVLFGDRMVIPNPDITITVDPININNIEWMVIPGGLSVQYNMIITAYVKLDQHDNSIRVAQKYGDELFDLFVHNIHLDVVNDEVFVAADVAAGDTEIQIPSLEGWYVDTENMKYEVQDNNHADIMHQIVEVKTSPPRVVLDRAVLFDYKVADKAVFRRRVRYIYNSLVTEVEFGFIQKGSAMYKASRVTWWGKETGDFQFPQTTHGGIT